MLIQKQLLKHEPENGVWGDCHRTALACILGLTPDKVPHFYESGSTKDFSEKEEAWLAQEGLVKIATMFEGNMHLEDVLHTVGALNPGLPYLLTGLSIDGVNHTVVCLNDQIVCDPSIDNSGVVGPSDTGVWWIEFLARRV